MGYRRLILHRDGIELSHLELKWRGTYKELQISVDGHQIGSVEKKGDLRKGQQLVLPDGATLDLKLERDILRIYRNGLPLEGYDPDSENWRKVGYFVLYLIGGMAVIDGLVVEIWTSRFSWIRDLMYSQ